MIKELKEAFKDYPEILNCKQVGEMLGVDNTTVTRYVRNGLRAYRTSGGKKAPFRFLKSDVIRYVEELQFDPER